LCGGGTTAPRNTFKKSNGSKKAYARPDGTLGIKEIKATLGTAMAQSADSAEYDAKPGSAYVTDLADYTGVSHELPLKLMSYVRHFIEVPTELPDVNRQTHTTLQKIFLLLRNQTGHDFTFYKKNTVYRRIERRMNLRQLKVKRFTPEAAKITNLISVDMDRPIDHMVSRFRYDRMRENLTHVQTSLIFKEIEVESGEYRWFLMRIILYRTPGNVIDGVVLTFIEISRLKEPEVAFARAREQLEKSGGAQQKRQQE